MASRFITTEFKGVRLKTTLRDLSQSGRVMLHMSLRRWIQPFPAAAIVAACDASATTPALVPIPPRDGAPVQTEALDYELRYGSGPRYAGRAVVTYRNDTSAPLYFDRLSGSLGPPLFELTAAWPGSFDVSVTQVFIGTGSTAVVVAPGATRVDTLSLELQDIDQPSSEPRFAGSSGVLRVRLNAYGRVNDLGAADHTAPRTELLSNAFRVRLAR